MNHEHLTTVQLALEQRGIDTGRENYLSQLAGRTNAWTGKTSTRSEADLPPGQALMARAVGPVALGIKAFYDECNSGYAGTGRDVVQFITPVVEHRGFETLAYIALKSVLANIGESRTRTLSAITTAVVDELRMLAFEHGHSDQRDEHGNPVPLSGLFKYLLAEARKSSGSTVHQRRVMGVEAARAGIGEIEIGRELRSKLGAELLAAVLGVTGWFELQERLTGARGTKTEQFIECTPEFAELLKGAHDIAALVSPAWPVMVTQPTDWTGMWDGAYLSEHLKGRLPLVKSPNTTTLREMHGHADAMAPVLGAVNALQHAAYRVNPFVLAFITDAWNRRVETAGLPPQDRLPTPNLATEAPHLVPVADAYKAWAAAQQKALGKDKWVKVRATARYEQFNAAHPQFGNQLVEFRDWKSRAKEVYDFNEHPRRTGDMLDARRTIAMAEELAGLDVPFYFPHQLDFRGRAYTVPLHLNPQGSDLSKGLLMFATGKALGERGARALAIHGANSWDQGLTKEPFALRLAWVLENEEMILATANDPWSTRSWWESEDGEGNLTGAECPLQFIAFCREWLGFRVEGPDYVCALPVAADGSCNGIQHWGLLLRDETVAHKVNLVNTDRPGDIYGDVAKWVAAKVEADCQSDDPEVAAMGVFWRGQVSRSLVKRNVMTKAYGLTAAGARKQLKDELKKNKRCAAYRRADKSMQKAALKYITAAVQEGIRREVKAAAVGMEWMQVVAEYLAKAGVPLNWSTPDGFIVWQGYKKKASVKIQTYLSGTMVAPRCVYLTEEVDAETGEVLREVIDTSNLVKEKKTKARMVVTYQEDTNELDAAKQALSVAPNFVHSLDATAMRMTALRCAEAGLSMMCVHDSFACHAADYDTMQRITREVAVEIHSADLLADWLRQVTVMLELAENGEELKAELHATLVEKFGGLTPARGTLDINAVLESAYFFA